MMSSASGEMSEEMSCKLREIVDGICSKDENHNIANFLSVLGKDRHMIGSKLLLSSMATLNMVRWS